MKTPRPRYVEWGRTAKKALIDRDITIKEMCTTLGITRTLFHKVLSGESPNISVVKRVSEYLELPVPWEEYGKKSDRAYTVTVEFCNGLGEFEVCKHVLSNDNDNSVGFEDGFITFRDDEGVIHAYNADMIFRYIICKEENPA